MKNTHEISEDNIKIKLKNLLEFVFLRVCNSPGDEGNKSCNWLPNTILLFFKKGLVN
jgi:hypothetical protein